MTYDCSLEGEIFRHSRQPCWIGLFGVVCASQHRQRLEQSARILVPFRVTQLNQQLRFSVARMSSEKREKKSSSRAVFFLCCSLSNERSFHFVFVFSIFLLSSFPSFAPHSLSHLQRETAFPYLIFSSLCALLLVRILFKFLFIALSIFSVVISERFSRVYFFASLTK